MQRLAVALLSVLLAARCQSREPGTVDIAAAASLQDALRVVAARYERETHEHIAFNFAGSNILARQINAGAPADVFLSADEAQAKAVTAMERRPLLSNTLVVVSIRPLHGVRDLQSAERIAIGDPSAVPAGVYAKQYLERIGLWKALEPRLVPMENVRAALAAVDNGSVDAAFVYRTDAALAKHAHDVLPIADGPRIVYPAVLRTARGRRFYDYLFTPEAGAVFRRFGFGVLSPYPHEDAITSSSVFQNRG
jgi:molybdate transport system substrate-binding protein